MFIFITRYKNIYLFRPFCFPQKNKVLAASWKNVRGVFEHASLIASWSMEEHVSICTTKYYLSAGGCKGRRGDDLLYLLRRVQGNLQWPESDRQSRP
jgi:hypothetical protein